MHTRPYLTGEGNLWGNSSKGLSPCNGHNSEGWAVNRYSSMGYRHGLSEL